MNARGREPEPTAGFDPEYGWCAWKAGERCRYPGSCTLNTRGGGPWYCAGHLQCNDPVIGAQIVDESIEACGRSPDYSLAGRRTGIAAKWQEDMVARGAMKKPVTPANARQAVDETTLHLTA